MGKGEIARFEHFLLFPQRFQKTYTADTLKPGLTWERVKRVFFFQSFENIVGKEENAGLTHSHTMTPFDAPGKQAF